MNQMSKDTIVETQKSETDKTRQIHKGYAIELKRKNSIKGIKFYLSNIQVVGPDIPMTFPIEDPRTLVYIASSALSKKISDKNILFFEDKRDAADVVTMIKIYQAYDEELCGPFKKGYKMIPKVVKVKSYREYSDLTKDFLDKNNHMDFNLEQDKAKKWLDDYIAKAKENPDA